jgi:diguanylate cyclase (GGDEF)-like protein
MNILLIDLEDNLTISIRDIINKNYFDINIYTQNSDNIIHNIENKNINLIIIEDINQNIIKEISQHTDVSIIVIQSSTNNLLVESYQNGATNYINKNDLLKVILPIIDIQMKHFDKFLENQHKINELIHIESVTKLPNRIKLIDDLQKEHLNINSISIIDINSFKEINDFYGHNVGDFILKSFADVVSRFLKDYNGLNLYKFPSDTYCITNSANTKEDFTNIIIKLLAKIENMTFSYKQHEIHVRATAGISFSQKRNKLITADLALQAAKADNKDYLVFYDKLDNIKIYHNNMLWTKKIKHALNDDNIIVYYQPLINNKTLKVEKYECLVRLIDKGKVVSPYFFLDISKKSNQYNKITQKVLEKSFEKFDKLDFNFSVNISYDDISSPNFLDLVKNLLSKYDVANKLIFELLEDVSIKNYDVLLDFIEEVKKLGCKIAIDDFGSGYSNFEKLLKLKADFLKIDASLIKNITTDKNSLLITKTIVQFAKDLKLKTIAEYVENEEIYNMTKEIGIDYSQGYYFAPPLENPTMINANNQENSIE